MQSAESIDDQLAGLDRLDLPIEPHPGRARRLSMLVWPPLAACGLVIVVWQLVVWSGWRPTYVLPAPATVFDRLLSDLFTDDLPVAVGITLRRALTGYLVALLVGVLLGLAIVRFRLLRAAIASLITGLQTMPSIAWFPFAILLFGLTEQAILFVVVLGAAPSVANGLIHGVDHIPRILTRAGTVLGARGIARYRYIILPAAFPAFVGGMSQAWAFAWRSLMAGELLVIIAQEPSVGVRLQLAREFSDAPGLLATMIVVLVIGATVDIVGFGFLQRQVRSRWGLGERAS
jgi:sulfonate transport system permease protein